MPSQLRLRAIATDAAAARRATPPAGSTAKSRRGMTAEEPTTRTREVMRSIQDAIEEHQASAGSIMSVGEQAILSVDDDALPNDRQSKRARYTPPSELSPVSASSSDPPCNAGVKTRDGRTKICIGGFELTRSTITSVKISYRCSFYRSQACPAKLQFYASLVDYDFTNMVPHTCTPPSQRISALDESSKTVIVKAAMQRKVDSLAVSSADTPQAIWDKCVVVMVFDQGTKLCVPVFYVLAASKTFDAYWNLLQYVSDACGQRIEPDQVVCDFESSLIQAVSDWFPDTDIVGCFFYFKQACFRKMKKLRIPNVEVTIAMEKGFLDMLTMVNPAKIDKQGMAWVRGKIKDRCEQDDVVFSSRKWVSFWVHFRKTWLRLLPPKVWNVHGIRRDLVTRTNNPLERFNREINAAFGTPHPSVVRIVQTIEEI